MTRVTTPGTIQEAVQRTFEVIGSQKRVAKLLGMTQSSVSYATDTEETRHSGIGVNHLDRLAEVDSRAAVPIAQYFAARAGGVFQPLDHDGALAADVHRLTREFSDVLALHAEAHSAASRDPSDYTPFEARKQVREIDELVSAAMQFRALLLKRAEGQAEVASVPLRGVVRS